MENTKQQKIEYETVTLKVPKKIMDYLRSMEKAYGQTPTENLEYSIVDWTRAEIEARTRKELADLFNLNPVFRALVNDEVL